MSRSPRTVLPLALLFIAAVLLSGCDLFGGSPTATPVPPTPTLTATPVPPTATPVPPTATTAAVQPTATAVAGATSAPTSVAQGTPGAMPTAPTGPAASNSDLLLIDDAITTTRALSSYHLALDLNALGQSVQGEGDYLAPDKLKLVGNIGGAQQVVIIGSTVYSLEADGKWSVGDATSGAFSDLSNFGITASADLFGTLARFIAAPTQAVSLGNETVDGVSLAHYSVPIFAGSLMGLGGSVTPGETPVGYAEVWIDPTTKYMHHVTANVDLTDFFQSLQGFAPTPGPGEPTPTPIPPIRIALDMSVSKFNEPVTIEAPDTNSTVAPATATPASSTSGTPPDPAAVWGNTATAMQGLKTYHAKMVVQAVGGNVTTDSDVVNPDSAHLITTASVGGASLKTEVIKTATRGWLRTDPGGGYGAWSDPGDLPLTNFGLAFDPASTAFSNVKLLGDETVGGVAARHYSFTLDPNAADAPAGASGGSGELWVANDSGYPLQIKLTTNVPIGGVRTDATIDITYSRFDDPAIVVEEPVI